MEVDTIFNIAIAGVVDYYVAPRVEKLDALVLVVVAGVVRYGVVRRVFEFDASVMAAAVADVIGYGAGIQINCGDTVCVTIDYVLH